MSEESFDRKTFIKRGVFKFFDFLRENLSESFGLSHSPIRPPGAIEESKFLDTCEKCGKCVSACTQGSIKFSGFEGGLLAGFPVVIPSEKPCFACDDLSCMKSCPTSALLFTPKADIRMGMAIVNIDKCITYQDKSCDICVKYCPFPNEAIFINTENHPEVTSKCIGCGLCEFNCDYRAIKIESNR